MVSIFFFEVFLFFLGVCIGQIDLKDKIEKGMVQIRFRAWSILESSIY